MIQSLLPLLGPLGVISDVHGNRWALEAVLEDIQRRGVRQVVNLGDSLYGPLAPAETAELLLAYAFPTVSGNEDRLIVAGLRGAKRSATLNYVIEQLSPFHLEWLAGLEMTGVYQQDFYLCHGSPQQDDRYLMVEITPHGVLEKSKKKLAIELSAIPQPIILCGHDHTPRALRLPNGAQVVNPGSVGLPAYRDDQPHPHAMQIGSPHARYSILEFDERGWRAYNYAVRYDWQAAAARALKNKRPDWAQWLITGKA